jgi:hypothetical protein
MYIKVTICDECKEVYKDKDEDRWIVRILVPLNPILRFYNFPKYAHFCCEECLKKFEGRNSVKKIFEVLPL